jgi:cobalt-zinc-cadmium efflux system outer membrane protein
MKLNLFWVPAIVVMFTAGCTTQHTSMVRSVDGNEVPQHVLESKAGSRLEEFASTAITAGSVETAPDELTMASAMALALKNNPSLLGFPSEIRAKDAAALQAGLLSNPELGVDVENFGGKDDLRGFDGAEVTIAFSQLVELGGKRTNRRLVATLDKTLVEWDYQSKKLDVLAETAKAFVEVLVAQEQVSMSNEMLRLAEQTTAAVSEKVDAGKVSPVEKSRVQIELAAAQIETDKTGQELEGAKRRLAALWGGERAGFSHAVGRLGDISALPNEDSLKTFLSNNPDMARWVTEVERGDAVLSLTRSEAVPDLSLSAGIRNFQDTGDNAFVLGVSIPIPLFNRNQGGVSEARALIDKAQLEQQAAKVTLGAALSDALQTLSAAYTEAVGLRDQILPGAQATYESTELGYREGKQDFLQMLDAQRTLFTVKRQYLESLGAYHLASSDIERLVGMPLSDMKNINKNNVK